VGRVKIDWLEELCNPEHLEIGVSRADAAYEALSAVSDIGDELGPAEAIYALSVALSFVCASYGIDPKNQAAALRAVRGSIDGAIATCGENAGIRAIVAELHLDKDPLKR
jgi:hypothetical protein